MPIIDTTISDNPCLNVNVLPYPPIGLSGYSGYSGSGLSGYSGYSGSGISGYSGFSGQDGILGGSGYSGYCGLSGYSGFCGLSGYSGFSGSGISGYSGYSGAGLSGYSGYCGLSGYSGFCGLSGYSGYSGSGLSGYSGYSGINGVLGGSGYSGYSGSGLSGYSGYSGAGLSGYSGYSGNVRVFATQLTTGNSTTLGSSFTTASITPSANQLVLLAVSNRKSSGTADTPTASGNGLTYTQIATLTVGGDTQTRITLFRAMGTAPTNQAITIDFNSVNQVSCDWSVVQFDFVDITGSGSNAIVQNVTNTATTATSLTATLGAFQNVLNASYGCFVVDSNQTLVNDVALNLLDTQAVANNSLLTEWSNTNVTAVKATGTSTSWAGIAVEIRCAAGGTQVHNNLSGLQGGTTAQYYHLALSDYTNVQNLGSLAYDNSLDFSQLTGLASFAQLDRTTTIVSETATVTIAANTKIYTTASGTLTTIAFSGGDNATQARRLELLVTGGPYTLTIPTCQRLGDTSSISSISIPNGYHEFSWEYINNVYILADSISTAISGYSGYSGYSGQSGYSGYSGSGISGYSGFSGKSGYSGYSGYSGLSGYSGYCGLSGYSGYSGSGISGYSGYSGAGLSGYSGYCGLSGYSGYSGANPGASGYSGFCGLSGYSGYSGYSGTNGTIGSNGVSGYSGYSGANPGASGYSGYCGLSGYSGYSGLSGYSGYSGTSGYSGYSGISGYSGYSGANPGASGYSGYSGLSGYSGYSGLSGYSGYSGYSGGGVLNADAPNSTVNIAVTSGSAVNLVSKTISITAGDQIAIHISGAILNNSGATKTYAFVFNLGTMTATITEGTTVAASATNRNQRDIYVRFGVNSTSSAWLNAKTEGCGPQALGTSSALVLNYSDFVGQQSSSNLTGSQTVSVQCYSTANTATQSFELTAWDIQKISTNP